MIKTFFNRTTFFFIYAVLLCRTQAFADQIPICGASVAVDQAVEVDEKNIKIALFGETQIMTKQAAPVYTLIAYLNSKENVPKPGPDKWKSVLEACLKDGDVSLSAISFLLYTSSSVASGAEVNTDYVESIFLEDSNGSAIAKEISKYKLFDRLSENLKNIIFLTIGIDDVHWLRVNLLGKTFYLSEDFKKFSEQKIMDALKVKKIMLAKRITAMLEMLYVANAEKYKKYSLACNLIEDLLDNQGDLNSSRLLTLVSIRNTDTSLRPVIDPFLIDGFQTLAIATVEKGKYEEALNLIASINADQATPTTYEVIKKILVSLDPTSKVLLNDTVSELLINSAKNNGELKNQLAQFLYVRVQKLLEQFDLSGALKSFNHFQEISNDPNMLDDLKLAFAIKYLQTGSKEAARKVVSTFKPTFSGKVKLFIDGYYGNPLFYVLIVLIPLVIKLSYEFFNKVSAPIGEEREEPAPGETAQEGSASENVSQFVSSSRGSTQKNELFEEYKDCLSIFQLEKGSDLKTIKTAYRNAVRKIHPDLHNSSDHKSEDASRFVELTKTYDRLRELHRLLGFESKL
jgi:hypothetical protein